jgi:hypothetical protein
MKAKVSTLQDMLNVIERAAGEREARTFEKDKVLKVVNEEVVLKDPTPTGKSKGGKGKKVSNGKSNYIK